MAKYRIIYLLLYLGAVAFAFAYESRLTLTLMITAMVLPIISFLLLLLTKLMISVKVEPDTVFTHKHQGFSLSVRIKNRFIMPITPLKVTGIFQSTESGFAQEQSLVLGVMPFSNTRFEFTGNISYRGEYMLGIENVEIYDLLRIFRFRVKFSPNCKVVIAPRRLSIDDNNMLSSDDNDSTRTALSFVNNDTFASVRKYLPGDSLSRIHWKLSAKQEDFVVKQMEQNLGTNAVIITDTRGGYSEEKRNMRAVDAVIEASLALTRKIVTDGRRAENIYRDCEEKFVFKLCEKQEDYETFFRECSVLPIFPVGKGIEDISDKFRNKITEAEMLIIFTSSLSAEELGFILSLGSSGERSVRIYTADEENFELLGAYAASVAGVSVFMIDPDDVALSLRNSML